MTQAEMDANLIVVAAVEGYAARHHIDTPSAYEVFKRNDLFKLLRSQYETLHTQSLDESVGFAEDVLARRLT